MITEKLSNEEQSQPSCLGGVSSRFSLLILSARLLTLELRYKELNFEMHDNPNEYTDNALREIKPLLDDLRRSVGVLENGY